MVNKVVTATTKGQITLPKVWRSKFKTSQFLLKQIGKGLFIEPLKIDEISEEELLLEEKEYPNVIFNAERDNNGKSIEARELLRLLNKINGQD